MDEVPIWVAVVGILVPAAVSIVAAVLSSRSARKAQVAENEAARLRQLEERTAQEKYKVYRPILQLLGDMLTPGRSQGALAKFESVVPDFINYISIWGSDDAVRAFARYRSAANYDVPPLITMRLVSDFLLAAREDLAGSTLLTGADVFGMRINDMYSSADTVDAFELPFSDLAAKYNWEIPWERNGHVTRNKE